MTDRNSDTRADRHNENAACPIGLDACASHDRRPDGVWHFDAAGALVIVTDYTGPSGSSDERGR